MYNDDLILAYHRHKINMTAPMSANFTWGEWFCKCGKCDHQKMHFQIISKLEKLRSYLGCLPMIITSGYRCPDHNKAVGGAPKSRHMVGDAADIKVKGCEPIEVGKAAKEVGFRGVKVYRSWTHVDLRPGATWFDIK